MYYNKLGILDSVSSRYERYDILFTSFLLYTVLVVSTDTPSIITS